MQKSLPVLVVTLSLSLIVLLALVQVNHSSAASGWNNGAQVADGIPMPPPQPKKTLALNNLVADGIPMPPPQPQPKKTLSLA